MNRTTLTSKGQLTIPIDIRRELGWETGAKLEIVREGDRVFIQPARSVAERTGGSLSKYRLPVPVTPEEEREWAARAMAEEGASYE